MRPAVSHGLLLSSAKDIGFGFPSTRTPFGGPAISALVDLRRPVGFASRPCSRFAFIGSEKNHYRLCRLGEQGLLWEIREKIELMQMTLTLLIFALIFPAAGFALRVTLRVL